MSISAPIMIPAEFRALREVFGETVSAVHFVGRMLDPRTPHRLALASWFNERYGSVFQSDQISWEGDRRKRLCEGLRRPESFPSFDAEVQVAANLLRASGVQMIAQAEGTETGVRKTDFVLTHPHRVEIEVRAVMGLDRDVEEDRVEESLRKRVDKSVRGRHLVAIVRVRRIRDAGDGRLLLDSRAEKRLAALVTKVINCGVVQERSVYVTLPPSAIPQVFDGRRSLADELAGIEIRTSQSSGYAMVSGGLREAPGLEEVRRALSRKRARGQHSGRHPWIVVLDVSSAPMLELEQMAAAVDETLSKSRSLAGVAIQRRRTMASGVGLSASDPWFMQFLSTLTPNPTATRPLPVDVADLFRTFEVRRLE
jgi:hypothetical protein